VTRNVQVELRDLEQLGPLLERAVDARREPGEAARCRLEPRKELEARQWARRSTTRGLNAETLARAAERPARRCGP